MNYGAALTAIEGGREGKQTLVEREQIRSLTVTKLLIGEVLCLPRIDTDCSVIGINVAIDQRDINWDHYSYLPPAPEDFSSSFCGSLNNYPNTTMLDY